MEKRAPLSLEAMLLLAVLGLFSLAVFAGDRPEGERITISGHLYADHAAMNDAIVVVELEQDLCLRSELRADGRFAFELPAGAKAKLVFLKPGYLVKEVLVDTRNAQLGAKANSNVRFDVVLDEATQHMNETYVGPVGYITFLKGTGLMRVRHDERMRPLEFRGESGELAVKP
jgi:hypothetical protein